MARTGRPKAEKVRVQCAVCGAEVERYQSQVNQNTTGRYFCSKECQDVLGVKPRRKPDATCKTCGKVFYPLSGAKNIYCSKVCHDVGQRKGRVPATCEVCGKSFEMKPSQALAWTGKFCSHECQGRSRWQRPLDRMHNGKPALLNHGGYVKVWEPTHPHGRSGWVLEHRLVAEREIGRYLVTEEQVHHVNGDKQDNQPENLEIMLAGDHASLTGYARAQKQREERDAIMNELEAYRRLYGPLSGKDT